MMKWVLFALALPGLAVVIWLGRAVPDPIKPDDVPQSMTVNGKNFVFHHTRHSPWGDLWTWMGPGGSANIGPHESSNMFGVLYHRGDPPDAIEFVLEKSGAIKDFTVGHHDGDAACATYRDRNAKVVSWFLAVPSGRGSCVINLTEERRSLPPADEACAKAEPVYDELYTAVTAICPE